MNLESIKSRCFVDPDTKCWHWLGYLPRSGPAVKINGVSTQVRRFVLNIRKGRYAHVACGIQDCVNPDHLLALSKSQYEKRKVRGADWRAALSVGIRKGKGTKINLDIARTIRARVGKEEQKLIAREYGVSPSLVSLIKRNDIWREVTPWSI